jgi:hypothetical protein
MTWIVDVELVDVAPAEPPDVAVVTFDVIYPGETWCRSVVYVAPGVACGDEEAVPRARDALLALAELEGLPVAFELRLTSEGTTVLDRRVPGRPA